MIPTSALLYFPSSLQCAANHILKLSLEELNCSALCLWFLTFWHSFWFHRVLWPLRFWIAFDLSYLFSWKDFNLLRTIVFWRNYMWVSVCEMGERSQHRCRKRSRRQRASDLGCCRHPTLSDTLHIVNACNVLLESSMVVEDSNFRTWKNGAGRSLAGGYPELHNKTLSQT